MTTASGQKPFAPQSEAQNSQRPLDRLQREVTLFCPPPALHRLNCILNSVPVDLKDLGEAIQGDPELVAEALKLCNSSLFRLSRPVSSLEQAVIVTDADMVRTLLLSCWLIKFTGSRIATRENHLFWAHSLLVAQLSRRIGEWISLVQPEHAFLAGLLHDVGILPFLTMLSKERTEKSQSIFETLGESIELQRHAFGMDHCELGRRIGTKLGLPFLIVEVCARHHQLGTAFFNMPLLCIIGAAEQISRAYPAAGGKGPPQSPPGQLIRDALAEYLPTLNPSVNLHLMETLQSDLQGGAFHAKAGAGNVWDDPSSHSGAQTVPREETEDHT